MEMKRLLILIQERQPGSLKFNREKQETDQGEASWGHRELRGLGKLCVWGRCLVSPTLSSPHPLSPQPPNRAIRAGGGADLKASHESPKDPAAQGKANSRGLNATSDQALTEN